MRRKRNRLRGLLTALLIAAVLLLAGAMVYKWVFVVRNVVIEGTVSVPDDEIIRSAHIDMGGPIRKVDADELRRNLESGGKLALDGVRIQLPNTVVLTVRERTRDAMILNGGRMLIMDSDGFVIEALASVPDNAPVYVTGLDATAYNIGGRITAPEDQLEAMKVVLDAVRNQSAAMYINELNVGNVMDLWIASRTGIRVELGDITEMDSKILWLRSVVPDLESKGEIKGTLDVSSGSKADYKP